jgi:uncharacterized protein DUF3303
VLKIFDKNWKMPASFTMHQFVVRVGDYGGYMIFETDQPADIHYFTSVFAVLEFKVEPVLDVRRDVEPLSDHSAELASQWHANLRSGASSDNKYRLFRKHRNALEF